MVQRMFFIEGENVFDAGFRVGLYASATQYDIKINATNLVKDQKIRVVMKGDIQNIEAFHSHISTTDIRSIPQTTKYTVGPMRVYNTSKIDWNAEELGLISDQISKILNVASTKLGSIDNNIGSINSRIEEVDKKFGVIGETLLRIDGKIPQGFTTNRESTHLED
jgi:acylphosphatase